MKCFQLNELCNISTSHHLNLTGQSLDMFLNANHLRGNRYYTTLLLESPEKSMEKKLLKYKTANETLKLYKELFFFCLSKVCYIPVISKCCLCKKVHDKDYNHFD